MTKTYEIDECDYANFVEGYAIRERGTGKLIAVCPHIVEAVFIVNMMNKAKQEQAKGPDVKALWDVVVDVVGDEDGSIDTETAYDTYLKNKQYFDKDDEQ